MRVSHYVVTNPFGLHTRISADLIRVMKGYASRVDIVFGDSVYSNDSILMLMQSGISRGGVFTLRVSGTDEVVCHSALDALILEKVGDKFDGKFDGKFE